MHLQSLFRVSLLFSFSMFYFNYTCPTGKGMGYNTDKKAPKLVDGKLVSDDPSFKKAIDNLKIQSIKKALPSSAH